MKYKSYEDLSDCIRRNIWKIPHDVDLIVGIPRSGMIPALMIAELLNKRCTDLYAFTEGRIMNCGGRERLMKGDAYIRKILVLDDTVYGGSAMRIARDKMEPFRKDYDILFACIYAEGGNAKNMVDIYLEENYVPGESCWLYEWNILHHYASKTISAMWDIDGLLCKDPPNDVNQTLYERYLPNAIPMIIPTTEVGALVTYRLEKYRDVTEAWLQQHGVGYRQLMMFNAPDRETRNKTEGPANFKARLYHNASWATLFVESSRDQAWRIRDLSGKPVFCYEDGKIYR